MCGEEAAVTRVFGIFDHQALVLGNLEATDPSHQLSTAREGPSVNVDEEDPNSSSWAPHHLLGVYSLSSTHGGEGRRAGCGEDLSSQVSQKGPQHSFSLGPGGRSMSGQEVILYGEGVKEGPSGGPGRG